MKLLWSIVSNFYTELVVGGVVTSPPPRLLFNQPSKKLECFSEDIIWVDKNFTVEEQNLIIEAVRNIEYFSNGLVRIILRFGLDSADEEKIKTNSVLLRVSPEHPAIAASDEKLQANTLGLCDYMTNDTRRLYLVVDRLPNATAFRTTAIHEFGHFIGMGYTEKPSIMYKHNNSNVLYPTYKDAKELGDVWDVDPECFRYFKL